MKHVARPTSILVRNLSSKLVRLTTSYTELNRAKNLEHIVHNRTE